jgi:hypothetical protein
MIKVSQIHTAINTTIENALIGTDFSEVEIISEDVRSGYQSEDDVNGISVIRPSLRVTFDTSESTKFNGQLKERTLPVRIYFFCKDRYKYKADNLAMQDIMENAFLEDVQVTPSFFMPLADDGNVQCSTTDGVLQIAFDLYSLEEIYDDSNLEPIEDLIFNLELKE